MEIAISAQFTANGAINTAQLMSGTPKECANMFSGCRRGQANLSNKQRRYINYTQARNKHPVNQLYAVSQCKNVIFCSPLIALVYEFIWTKIPRTLDSFRLDVYIVDGCITPGGETSSGLHLCAQPEEVWCVMNL